LFAEFFGIFIVLSVAAAAAWQFRGIVVETELDALQRRAILILMAGAAGWLRYLLRTGI